MLALDQHSPRVLGKSDDPLMLLEERPVLERQVRPQCVAAADAQADAAIEVGQVECPY